LSVDDKAKPLFGYTEAVPVLMQMMINFPGERLGKELAALAINLSWVGPDHDTPSQPHKPTTPALPTLPTQTTGTTNSTPNTLLLISVSSSCLLILVLISARSPGIQVPRMAEGFAHYPKKNAGLYELMQRVEQKRDPLLMKVKGPW